MISNAVLVLAEGFSEELQAHKVAHALARGLEADGRLSCDRCPLQDGTGLDELDFDRRMRAARALVIAWRRLSDETLSGSVAFEAATRARQGGVPAYAVTAEDLLDPFEARILDLQVVLRAGNARALGAAARKLAAIV